MTMLVIIILGLLLLGSYISHEAHIRRLEDELERKEAGLRAYSYWLEQCTKCETIDFVKAMVAHAYAGQQPPEGWRE